MSKAAAGRIAAAAYRKRKGAGLRGVDLCQCEDCQVGRAAALERKLARDGGKAPPTKVEEHAAFQELMDRNRAARRKRSEARLWR